MIVERQDRGSRMNSAPIVYVFTCGNAGVLGFSLQKYGANLPSASPYSEKWSRAYEVQMSALALGVFGIDTTIVLSDLGSCGYHIALPVPDTQSLPKYHRASS
jgi:hypothetical protein